MERKLTLDILEKTMSHLIDQIGSDLNKETQIHSNMLTMDTLRSRTIKLGQVQAYLDVWHRIKHDVV